MNVAFQAGSGIGGGETLVEGRGGDGDGGGAGGAEEGAAGEWGRDSWWELIAGRGGCQQSSWRAMETAASSFGSAH